MILVSKTNGASIAEEWKSRESEHSDDLNEIVSQSREGSHIAFEELVARTENLARKIALSLVGRAATDDILQESYLLVYRKLANLKSPEAFLGWFSRIVLRTCYDYLDKSKKPNPEPEPKLPADLSETVVNQVTLQTALSRLSKKDRDILILRELLELRYEEVAVALRIPVGTVRSRLNKARKHLSERLELTT